MSQLKNKNRNCELSQKFHRNKIRTVFSAFGSEKQKRTTSVVTTVRQLSDHKGAAIQRRPTEVHVHTHYANDCRDCVSQLSAGDLL